MNRVLFAGKKFTLALYTALSLLQVNTIGNFVTRWAFHWQSNKGKILMLTSINTTITLGTEFISRSSLKTSPIGGSEYGFVVGDGVWYNNINKQSLINVWMTFFASLLGAPVYFFSKGIHRFLFFVGFGVFNSFLSQNLISFLRTSFFGFSMKRIFFDFCYNGTLKFFMFEYFRKPIKRNHGWAKLAFYRGKQDILTSFFKTTILNLFRFKG